jgi:hypothetical protein
VIRRISWKRGGRDERLSGNTNVASAYLKYSRERQNEARASTHEEDGGYVQAKGKGGIGEEYKGTYTGKREEWREALCEGENGEVDDGADRRVVVERDKRVHLETV